MEFGETEKSILKKVNPSNKSTKNNIHIIFIFIFIYLFIFIG
jgi:hypothetical protein